MIRVVAHAVRRACPWRLVLFIYLVPALAAAQPDVGILVWPRHPVYDLLDRLEVLGCVRRAGLETRPLTRGQVAELLAEVPVEGLRRTDREQVLAFRAEFAPREPGRYVSRDGARLEFAGGGSGISFGPSIKYVATGYRGDGINRWRELGVEGFGHVGPWLWLGGTAHAIVEQGARVGPPAANGPARGLTGWVTNDNATAYYYDTTEGYVALAWRTGGIRLGQFPQSWGTGRRGQIFLSDKPPSSPQIALELRPWRWLSYRFVHAQLESGIIDSETVRHPTPRETFSRFYPKYLVAQRLEVWPLPRVRAAVNESVVYGASGIDLGYLVPLIDLRHVQHAKSDRDNVQLGADVTVWWPRRTALSAGLFIDELKTSVMFDAKHNRNWVAGQVGLRVADLWGLAPGSMTRVEYTRVNPWVYEHRYPWSTFMTAGNGPGGPIPLGYWLGQNADDLYGEISYDVTGALRLTAWAEHTRKGRAATVGTQPYDGLAYQATSFLAGPVTRTWRAETSLAWRTWRHLQVEGAIGHERTSDAAGRRTDWYVRVGAAWGRW